MGFLMDLRWWDLIWSNDMLANNDHLFIDGDKKMMSENLRTGWFASGNGCTKKKKNNKKKAPPETRNINLDGIAQLVTVVTLWNNQC